MNIQYDVDVLLRANNILIAKQLGWLPKDEKKQLLFVNDYMSKQGVENVKKNTEK